MKYIYQLVLLIVLSHSSFAEFSIHVLNPWMDDTSSARRDSLRMVGNAEVNYYPGSSMVPEGGGWFVYTYLKESKTSSFKITTWIGPQAYKGSVTYGRSMRIDSLFARVPPNTEDIWVVLNPDTTKFPAVYDAPPGGKVVYLLNPWPENSPKISINNQPAIQMRFRDDLCGWYQYYFAGPSDSLQNVTFKDYYSKKVYSSHGLVDGPGIDLHKVLKNYDTVYVLPRPFPAGAPSLSSFFPGRLGDCSTRKVSGIFRDWKFDNVSFFNQPIGASTGHKGMVMSTLTAPDWKPKLTNNSSVDITKAEKLETWFKTITFPDGTDNDTCIDLVMTKGYDGRWTFDSDNTGGFFPLDDFDNPNNIKYLDRLDPKDKSGTMHNFHFSMEMHMQFVYQEGIGLEFNFRGDDDVWIYVNNKLVIDLGGLNYMARGTLNLDKEKNNLQLVDGEIYNMDIFFAERNPIGSNFLIRTSMDLRNSSELYYKEKPVGPGNYQYDIWQQVQSEANDCGLTRLTDGEELSNVDFYIEGPQFTEETILPSGVHYGGITVDQNGSRITIDSLKLDGLISGDYRVIFISKYDKNRSGYLTFHVAPKPDHLDLLPDTVLLDLKRDMIIDSIIMGEETDSLILYSVIRDVYGSYIEDGTNLTWSSGDETVVTISPSADDDARATITKVGSGPVWIMVSHNSLKPDSVLIHAKERPNWPLIASAKLIDSHGDVIPDIVHITLSDTFKTGQSLTLVELSYNNNTYSIPAKDCHINGNLLRAPFKTSTGTDSQPFGTATLVLDVNGREREHDAAATDGVGPVLKEVEILEKGEDDPDILYLTFSEPIFPATLIGSQYLLIKNGTVDTIQLGTSTPATKISSVVYSIEIVPIDRMPVPGDNLRLVPASNSGNVSDVNNNQPHDLNPSVNIKLRKGAAPITASWYKDTDADGILDSLYVHFKRDVDLSEFDASTVQWKWNQKLSTIDPSMIRKSGDSVIAFPLRGVVVSNTTIATSGGMYLTMRYKNTPNVTRTKTVADSAAPVLLNAKLYFAGFDENGIKEYDTLRVTFSEPTKSTGTLPFRLFSNETLERYSFQSVSGDVQGIQCEFLINGVIPPTIVPQKGDSIWINETTETVDVFGSIQKHSGNHRAILEVFVPPVEWIMKVGPNPVNLIDQSLSLIVQPKRVVDISHYNTNVLIYDRVGNIIATDQLPKNERFFFYDWNGTNTHGRFVGTGTYLVIVTIYKDNNLLWSDRKKIGVKGR